MTIFLWRYQVQGPGGRAWVWSQQNLQAWRPCQQELGGGESFMYKQKVDNIYPYISYILLCVCVGLWGPFTILIFLGEVIFASCEGTG